MIQAEKSATLACNNDQVVFQPINGSVSGTLDASCYKGCGARAGVEREVILESRSNDEQFVIRRLTPQECASLQGFPKDWTADVPHSDTAEYKMWGNGMALPCVLYVMEGIADILRYDELDSILGS